MVQFYDEIPVPPPNHKIGDWNSPDKIDAVDIYDRSRPAPGKSYSSSSRLLNVGVKAVSELGLTDNYGGNM
jgi:hypothetical protein